MFNDKSLSVFREELQNVPQIKESQSTNSHKDDFDGKDHSKDPLPKPVVFNDASNFISFRFDKPYVEMIKEFVEFSVAKHKGNQRQTALTLKVSPRTIGRILSGGR